MTTTVERIAELTAAWEDAVNYGELPEYHAHASDCSLSEDDWQVGLSEDEAAEIVALIERQAENQKRAERIAAEVLTASDAHGLRIDPSEVEQMLTAAALAGMENAS